MRTVLPERARALREKKSDGTSSKTERKLGFGLAINEALTQMLDADPCVMVIGQGVTSPWYVGNTCNNLVEKFGELRVMDTPVSENATTGVAVGAAIAGMRPVVVHPRVDFAVYAFDPIINQAANWNYMSGGKSSVPVVFWLIVNRGGEQAAQHSQALHTLFAHIPGLKVVAPSTPSDAKGLLIAAIRDNNPVVFIDDRWLYRFDEHVPEEIYEVPIGKGIVRKKGQDATLISFSYLAYESQVAVTVLEKQGIDVELIDIRSLKPLDEDIIFQSVKKTGKLVIADGSWKMCGYSAEIAARIAEVGPQWLRYPVKRVNLPDTPAPASISLEKAYYITSKNIIDAVKSVCL